MIHRERPEDFNPRFEIVSCFLEYDGKFLLLLRQDNKPQGNTWGVPAGKVEKGESKEEAVIREVEEETGYKAEKVPQLIDTVYVRYPEFDFTYHIFYQPLPEPHNVVIDASSHKEYCWTTPQEALALPLIPDLDHCIELFYFSR